MRKIIETVREYDATGNLTREVVTETTEEGEAEKLYAQPTPPAWWGIYPPSSTGVGVGVSVPTVWVNTDPAVLGSTTCASSTPENSTPTKGKRDART